MSSAIIFSFIVILFFSYILILALTLTSEDMPDFLDLLFWISTLYNGGIRVIIDWHLDT